MIAIEKIYKEVIAYLKENLSPDLYYHNVAHTKYVYRKAKHIATKEGVSKKNIYYLQVAALFHDIGFVHSTKDHEKQGCIIATKWLKKYGFSKDKIELIKGMIRATKLPQNPQNHLEEIIADADLCYLGTTHFPKGGQALYKELKVQQKDLTPQKWNKIQIEFLSNHKFHTKFCQRYYEFRKQKNLSTLL